MRFPPLPADTAHAAETAFGRDHPHLKIGREIEAALNGFELPAPLPQDTMLAKTLPLYSLASVLQYWEDLTDHQMVGATRNRLDLKYALHLPLDFPGFEPWTLCKFRQQALADPSVKEAFQEIVDRLRKFALDPGKSRADADQIITALCLLSRAETVVEAMGNALEAVATHCPDWLLSNALPHWYRRYYQRPEPQQIPREAEKIEELLQNVGKDGQHLLATLCRTNALGCSNLPEIQELRRMTARQFEPSGAELRWRSEGCSFCAGALQGVNTTAKKGGFPKSIL